MGAIADYFKELLKDPFVKAVLELRDKRIAAQQKRRMNSYGRWSKMMRENRLEGDNKYEETK